MSYKFIAPNSEQPKDESAGPESQEKLAVPEVKSEPALHPVKVIEEPTFNDLEVSIFKARGFVIVQYYSPPHYMTLTKKQAKEFARLLVKEAL